MSKSLALEYTFKSIHKTSKLIIDKNLQNSYATSKTIISIEKAISQPGK